MYIYFAKFDEILKWSINYTICYRTSNSSVLTIVAFSLERYELFTGFNIFVVRGQNSIAVDIKFFKSIKSLILFQHFCRYFAICHPYYSYTMSGLHRASKIISAVWFLALITAIPYAVCTEVLLQKHPITEQVTHIWSHNFFHVIIFSRRDTKIWLYVTYHLKEIPESAFCTVNPAKTPSYLFESSTFLFFVIPMIIMLILYIRMGLTIHNQRSNR